MMTGNFQQREGLWPALVVKLPGLFGKTVRGRIVETVCPACGHVELYVGNIQEFSQAYKARNPKT
jgi:hypothetical protein